MNKLLEIKDLQIDFEGENGWTNAVGGISLDLGRGETLGIVGESGSGKSVTALSVMRLLSTPPARYSGGQILFQNRETDTPLDLLAMPEEDLRKVRGAQIAMIFQEPMTSLNPVFRCGKQVTEAIQLHQNVSFAEARERALALFERVKLPDPARIFQAYPHQISGGQKQRVMIAMAMSCQPSLLIADEPTTALDVTVQKAILDLMRELREERQLSMIFISHDLGVIGEIADRAVVMHKGKIVESGSVEQILQRPQHPYTQGLVACRPSLGRKLYRMPTVPDFLEKGGFEARVVTTAETTARQAQLGAASPILSVEQLSVRYPARKNWLGRAVEWTRAVDRVSFEVFPGETFGLAGESGCGKTTLGRTLAKLVTPREGVVRFEGQVISDLDNKEFRPFRKHIQMVFQDPFSSLNPRMTIGEAILEPMKVHDLHSNDRLRREKVAELLTTVGLEADHASRYPHEFSGGQRQRICIARTLALEPRLLICDEIVSALDVSVQATVLNLLMDLQEKFGLTYVFISHDLSVIKQMCDRLMIMNRGKIEQIGYPDQVFAQPETDYVRKLIEAIPRA
ncbi:MAG: ABC transporter ATP-binding protein [Saprospiraceae bacterium]